MTTQPKARVLKDLSEANQVLLTRLMAGEDVASTLNKSTKEEGAQVISYTPKKGPKAGVPGNRLQVTGNFFPVLLTQDQARVLTDFAAAIKSFSVSGK